MRRLRYCINVTLDGCCDHRAVTPDEEMHRYHAENLQRADALLYGRVTYEMMEAGWRHPWPDGRPSWMEPFADVIGAAKKYVVSSTLPSVDWNAELLRGDLRSNVERLKQQPSGHILTGGLTLPLALAELGLIDEYDFLVQPKIVGRGPKLFDGLSKAVDLKLVNRRELSSGAVALHYEPRR